MPDPSVRSVLAGACAWMRNKNQHASLPDKLTQVEHNRG